MGVVRKSLNQEINGMNAFDEYVYGIRHDSTLRGLKQMRITQLIH